MSNGLGFGMLFAVGFGIIGWGVYCMFKAQKASRWPFVLGTMNNCEIKETSDVDGRTYRVHVGYSYEVYGRQYHGNRIAFGYSGTNKHAEHAALYDKLSRASNVIIRYNPSNPSNSVLTYGLNLSTIRILAFGIMWLLFVTGFTALWTLSSGAKVWTFIFGLTLLFFMTGFITIWVLSRKMDKIILNRIEIR